MTVTTRQANERLILSMSGICGHRTASFAQSIYEITLSSPLFRQVLLITWWTKSLSVIITCYSSSLFPFLILLAFSKPCQQFMYRSPRTTFRDRFGARFKTAALSRIRINVNPAESFVEFLVLLNRTPCLHPNQANYRTAQISNHVMYNRQSCILKYPKNHLFPLCEDMR